MQIRCSKTFILIINVETVVETMLHFISGSIYEQELSNSRKHIKHTLKVAHVTRIWHIRNKLERFECWDGGFALLNLCSSHKATIASKTTAHKLYTVEDFYGTSMIYVLNLTLTTSFILLWKNFFANFFCAPQNKESHHFGKTWGGVKYDDRILIIVCTSPGIQWSQKF